MKDNINPKHYTRLAISPLEYIMMNKIEWCEGNVIKYVSRYKMKNGYEDLKKAQWYLNHLIKQHEDYEPEMVKIGGHDVPMDKALKILQGAQNEVDATPEAGSEAAAEEVEEVRDGDPVGGATQREDIEFFEGRDPLRVCSCDIPEIRPTGHTYAGYCNQCGYRGR